MPGLSQNTAWVLCQTKLRVALFIFEVEKDAFNGGLCPFRAVEPGQHSSGGVVFSPGQTRRTEEGEEAGRSNTVGIQVGVYVVKVTSEALPPS